MKLRPNINFGKIKISYYHFIIKQVEAEQRDLGQLSGFIAVELATLPLNNEVYYLFLILN